MTEQEINRRIGILENKKIPLISRKMMRGGMQDRLHRREILRHGQEIKKQEKQLKSRLFSMQQEKEDFILIHTMEELGDFQEPVLKRIRSKRGFFGYE